MKTELLLLFAMAGFVGGIASAQPTDPGVRNTATDNGPPAPLPGMGQDEMTFFEDGLARFKTIEVVSGADSTQGNGLGPRFNSNSCVSCHMQPNPGGSSPAANPLFSIASAYGASNTMPWFIVGNGPVREARFVESNGVPDGGVHDLFVISGRSDAGSCAITQPSFTPAGNPVTGQGGNSNVIFRIPTPVFGAGLIEAISDSAILANMQNNATHNAQFGVHGHANSILGGNVNLSANDGTITRFGWKAQNKSLLMFAGEDDHFDGNCCTIETARAIASAAADINFDSRACAAHSEHGARRRRGTALLLHEEGGQLGHVVRPDDEVDVPDASEQRLALLLRHAPGHGDDEVRPRALQRRELTDLAPELLLGLLPHAAGVDHDDVGVSFGLGRLIALGFEQARQPLGVV